jgi:DMSO reductase family type II enzyme heme b subunit
MIRQHVALIAAPPALSPGGYVPRAYAERVTPSTARADLEIDEQGGLWTIALSWEAAHPVRALDGDPARFVDAAALLVPATEAAQAMTMGAPGDPVEGVLWRADRDRPLRIAAQGLGTVERGEAPAQWSTEAEWRRGRWHLRFTLGGWAALERFRRLGVAVWQGAARERAGLKSVTPAWIALS